MKLKKGDNVIVIRGADRGKTGTIEKVFPKKGTAFVPGVAIYKKHIKKSVARDGKGGVYEISRPVDMSKLALVDPKGKKATRVGFKMEGDQKVRIAKKSKSIVK